jgi:hypothetical protein
MGVVWEKTSVYFRCDIPGCGAEHTESCDDDWDDRRAALPRVRDLGWSVDRHGKAFCPDCTAVSSYDEIPGS